MVKEKLKKRLLIIFGVILILLILISSLWYFRFRIPNDYGYFSNDLGKYPPNESALELNFNGKKYKNITGTDLANSVKFGAWTLGRVKAPQGDGPIVIYSVFGHQDIVLVNDQAEMGWSTIFQEEK